ncbi:hypothetical protein [Streptomyces canus]|uniref:hypothetical protein n=1 Tax=Streptomyces canus TaxID=58343 RepID=UPI003F4B2D3D
MGAARRPRHPRGIIVALAVVAYGPLLAARPPWRALLCTARRSCRVLVVGE